MNRKRVITLALAGMILLVAIVSIIMTSRPKGLSPAISYGISPYQDTAMPVVAESLGLYEEHGLNVDLVSIDWENIVPSLASAGRTIDVAVGSINLLLPRAENINVKGGGDVVFFFPLYVFKGAAIMMQKDSRLTPLSEFLERYPDDHDRAVRAAMEQIKGKKIGVPPGTPYEQMLTAAARTAGLDPETDIDVRHVKLTEALPAFLAGDLDMVGAGVTQRTEAMRYGHKVFMDMESFGFAEIVGILTTKHFAEEHPEEMEKLVRIWFESVDTLMSDIDTYSKPVLDYLDQKASTKYTLEEYKKALTFQEFPRSVDEAQRLMMAPKGKFYWKRTWDIVNSYLVETGKTEKPIPHRFFLGTEALTQFLK
ncbi:hypothetical protein ES703_27543 [subsurface metagenome]